MIAFAANSVLGRMAIGSGETALIDPASYSAVRLASGAVMLALLVAVTGTGASRSPRLQSGSWASAFALFAYAVAFSYAYVALDTGVGALILFACVQATMIGRALMAMSGIAWGVYSLRGRGLADPLKATADNFMHSVAFIFPLLGVVLLAQLPVHASAIGVMLALASGALTSGLGYALWYRVLRQIGATQGAIVQLTVPVIAAAGGSLLLGEGWTLRLVVSSVFILGGVALAIIAKQRRV